MSFVSIIIAVLAFLWSLLKEWLWVFIIPFTTLATFWIILPIWLSWFFAEFFQEKEGTSFGNAISNGVIPFWVGIDWLRQLTNQLLSKEAPFSLLVFSKYFISFSILAYGLIIIIYGIRGRSFVRFAGRIREVSYVLAVFTPFIYGLIEPHYQYFLAIILFFPLFYFTIELINRYTPEPRIYKKEESTPPSPPPDKLLSDKLL